GRQPRQLRRLALLGFRAGCEHRRQGLLRVDELRQSEAHRLVPLTRRGPTIATEEHERMIVELPANHRERGVTLFGLLFWAIVIGFGALIVLRVLPTMNEFFTIQRAVNKIAVEG